MKERKMPKQMRACFSCRWADWEVPDTPCELCRNFSQWIAKTIQQKERELKNARENSKGN
jgi:hypothetical protein